VAQVFKGIAQVAVSGVAIALYLLYSRSHGWAGWILFAGYMLLFCCMIAGTVGSFLAGEYLFFLPLLAVTVLWAFVLRGALRSRRRASAAPRAYEDQE
jgi:hypothetical protein